MRPGGAAGVTLTELMVATAILSVVVLGSVGAFSNIQKSVQASKNRSFASTLAQERMQVIKQQSYYKILVSTSTAIRTDVTPFITHDAGYYAPETVLEGGVLYERLVYVQVAREDSGAIVTLPPTTPDTGMKLVSVCVVWFQGSSRRSVQVRSIAANPDASMGISVVQGAVRNAVTLLPIAGTVVTAAENVGWRDTTNAGGAYAINLNPGTLTLTVSAHGYFQTFAFLSVAPYATLTQDFNLAPMASGDVRGTVWASTRPVISQVVGSSVNAAGFAQEWVEVFNPTTYTWTMAGGVGLRFQRANPGGDAAKRTILVDYATSTVEPGRYYLFASTSPVTAGGLSVLPDATWSPANSLTDFPYFGTNNNIIPTSDMGGEGGGALELYRVSDGATLDVVGWDRNGGGQTAPFYETDGIDQNIGLQVEEQFVRRASTSGYSLTLGAAYDSGNNETDFMDVSPLAVPPRASQDASQAVVSGVPMPGAIVSASDGLSTPATSYLTGSPPYAQFILPSVATGTWAVFVTSAGLYAQVTTVTVTAGLTTMIPSSMTTPSWPQAGVYALTLSTVTDEGFLTGRVTNVFNNVITPYITVTADGHTVTTDGDGNFFINVAAGSHTVTANPNNLNTSYVQQDQGPVYVSTGQVVAGVSFILSQGGSLTGFVTRDGVNALPGITLVALDSNNIARDQAVTGTDGRFLLTNLTTGTYTVEPVLDSGEISSPSSVSRSVAAGATVFASTFTISAAFGTITGTVRSGLEPIRTGVLVVVATGTISGMAPPDISSASLAAAAYYATSSLEDGSYRLDVRGSTVPYRVYGHYGVLTSTSAWVTISTSVPNVTVTAGQTTANVSLQW